MWVWCKYVFGLKAPYLTGLAAALATYLAVALMERRDSTAKLSSTGKQ